MSIANKGKLIIAAIASRPYVKAAVMAGYEVVAIDAFTDVDVQKLAAVCYQVDLSDGQLDKEQLLSLLDGLDLQQYVGLCYGAGFEKDAEVLSEVNERLAVLGNSADVVRTCKSPSAFFGLCDQLQLPFPPTVDEQPLSVNSLTTNHWVKKSLGGSGGAHICWLSDVQAEQVENVYYQQFQSGRTISCLFVASDSGVEVIGFNEQWVDATDEMPFRYGGAVSHTEVSGQIEERLTDIVIKLSQAMGLIGINSCDVICDGDEVTILEVNPRLSATVDLYASGVLMEKHIAAIQHQTSISMIKSNDAGMGSKAHQIIYADHTVVVKDAIIWPEWVCDVPSTGSRLSEGMPVCTVIAEAKTAEQAKKMVKQRVLAIKQQLLN